MGKEFCPNVQCPDLIKYEIGTECPSCGTEIHKMGFFEGGKVVNEKQKLQISQESILIRENMGDEDIATEMKKDMTRLAMLERVYNSPSLILLSVSSTDQWMTTGFAALITQNSIIIRQNELIRRALERMSKSSENPNSHGTKS